MADAGVFVDYYDVLRVDPNCGAKTLEFAYKSLLKAHHPDHAGNQDTTRFAEVVEAYRTLRDPDRRTEYDALRLNFVGPNPDSFSWGCSDDGMDQNSALKDAEDHARILMFLYRKRREHAQSAGVPAYYLKEMLDCSDEHFDFHQWYLKEKGFLSVTEQGTLAITIQGVDHVIATSRSNKAEKLLIAQVLEPKA